VHAAPTRADNNRIGVIVITEMMFGRGAARPFG
jgi:hypothetical protein